MRSLRRVARAEVGIGGRGASTEQETQRRDDGENDAFHVRFLLIGVQHLSVSGRHLGWRPDIKFRPLHPIETALRAFSQPAIPGAMAPCPNSISAADHCPPNSRATACGRRSPSSSGRCCSWSIVALSVRAVNGRTFDPARPETRHAEVTLVQLARSAPRRRAVGARSWTDLGLPARLAAASPAHLELDC